MLAFHAHPQRFVELLRAGPIVRIDDETDLALAPPVEVREYALHERPPDAAAPPLPPHRQLPHPAHSLVSRAHRHTGQFQRFVLRLSRDDCKEVERGIERLPRQHEGGPLLEPYPCVLRVSVKASCTS